MAGVVTYRRVTEDQRRSSRTPEIARGLWDVADLDAHCGTSGDRDGLGCGYGELKNGVCAGRAGSGWRCQEDFVYGRDSCVDLARGYAASEIEVEIVSGATSQGASV